MAVIAVKTELKCKLCQHPEREAIDALLEQRSRKQKDEAGAQINADYVITRLGEMGVENPNLDNIKNHWRKHCQVVQEATKEELDQSREELIREIRQAVDNDSLDELLEKVARRGLGDALVREALEGKSGITVDHALKAIDSITRRKQENSQRKFFEALGGGIAKALTGGTETKQLGERGEVVREIDAAPEDVQEVTT